MTTPASSVTAEKSEVTGPCPFCGTHPKMRITMEQYPAEGDSPAGEYDAWYTFGCDECGIEIGAEYRSEALENWNKRNAPEKHFTSYADVPEPLPMEAEIWAAGADPETAHFVARMLGDQGYELIQNEPAEDDNLKHVWAGKIPPGYGELEQCTQCGVVKRPSNADAICSKASILVGSPMEQAAEAVWDTLINAIKPPEGRS
ncbi:hypothetical protein N8D56_21455 [Devosia sp. A8/3-2]|nr:hypothetical protein N8D56_21455 [Devosia sp. A8/3-2]